MAKQFPYTLTIATIVLLTAFAAVAAVHAPAGARLAVHWNDVGLPDASASPWKALFIPVGLCVALIPVSWLLSQLLGRVGQLVGFVLALIIVWEAMIAAPIFGVRIPPTVSPILAVCGLFWILMGNDMPKSRPVLRKPETRHQINRMIATKRFSSRFWIVGGIVTLGAALLPLDPQTRSIVDKVALWGIVILPAFFYDILWRPNESRVDTSEVGVERRDRPSS